MPTVTETVTVTGSASASTRSRELLRRRRARRSAPCSAAAIASARESASGYVTTCLGDALEVRAELDREPLALARVDGDEPERLDELAEVFVVRA